MGGGRRRKVWYRPTTGLTAEAIELIELVRSCCLGCGVTGRSVDGELAKRVIDVLRTRARPVRTIDERSGKRVKPS
jgi:hypothetical protein